jgi:hypothetical protein
VKREEENEMGRIFMESPKLISRESVDCEEDLKLVPRKINLNPPPEDGRCECCGRHISELKPFGGPGDPLVGDFSGAYLIKKFRSDLPPDREAYLALKVAIKDCYDQVGEDDMRKVLTAKYGRKKGKYYYEKLQPVSVGKSWECRDCACLDEFEYFEKRAEVERSRQGAKTCEECRKAADPRKSKGMKGR